MNTQMRKIKNEERTNETGSPGFKDRSKVCDGAKKNKANCTRIGATTRRFQLGSS